MPRRRPNGSLPEMPVKGQSLLRTCDNCDNQAVYLVASPAHSDVYYCSNGLPSHLRPQADAGHLDVPAAKTRLPADV